MSLNSVLANLLQYLIILLDVFNWAFLAYIIIKFFPISEDYILIRVLKGICEPPYKLILKIIPPLKIGMLDLSPIYVFILIDLLQWVFRYLIVQLGK